MDVVGFLVVASCPVVGEGKQQEDPRQMWGGSAVLKMERRGGIFLDNPDFRTLGGNEGYSGKKKAHKLLTHKLFVKAVAPGTTSRLTRRKRLFSWFRRRTHKLFCPVDRPVVPGSTGP